MNFYKHHIGDYDADTSHLSWHEDMAYTRLMRLYYRTERPIPTDIAQAYRLVRAASKIERKAVHSVLREFFRLNEDGWHNKRCDEEISNSSEQNAERNAKNENEKERQRRHRKERKALFDQLRTFDIVPAWDTKTEALRSMIEAEECHNHVTPHVTLPVTPVTRTATANQTPDSRLQRERCDSPENGEPPTPPKTRKKPATKCPEGFAVTDEMYGWAGTRGLQGQDVERETEKFLLYHGAKGTLFSDWHQAWMNWMLKSVEFRAQRRSTA